MNKSNLEWKKVCEEGGSTDCMNALTKLKIAGSTYYEPLH